MAIRVAQLGTGNVGIHSLKALIGNPEFELTGVWVSSDAKAGRDAAELGLDGSTGVLATTDLDAVLATGPQCAVYNAMADNRLPEALKDAAREDNSNLFVGGIDLGFGNDPLPMALAGTCQASSWSGARRSSTTPLTTVPPGSIPTG